MKHIFKLYIRIEIEKMPFIKGFSQAFKISLKKKSSFILKMYAFDACFGLISHWT